MLLFKYFETLTFLGDLRLAVNGLGLLIVLLFLAAANRDPEVFPDAERLRPSALRATADLAG